MENMTRESIDKQSHKDRNVIKLSQIQQQLWSHNAIYPTSSMYTTGMEIKLSGILDQSALVRALEEVINRNEMLRATVFQKKDGLFFKIHPTIELPFTFCPKYDEGTFEKEIMTVFDLEKGPLIKFTLLKCTQDIHILIVLFHHLIFDGASFSVFFEELSRAYNHYSETLEPLLWSQKCYSENSDSELSVSLDYWKDNLKGIEPINLPLDNRRMLINPAINVIKFNLPSETAANILKFCDTQHITPFNVLLCVYCTLLHRYSNQDDFTVGIPFYGRENEDLENIIGYFVKTLPIRIQLKPQMKFSDLLNNVMLSFLEAYEHQNISLGQLTTILNLSRTIDRETLYQVGFSFNNNSSDSLSMKGLQCEMFNLESGRLPLDISMEIYLEKNSLEVFLKYNANIFTRSKIENMGQHWQMLLEDSLNDPTKQLCNLSILTTQEKHQILINWNDTQKDYPKDKTIHQLFEEQVVKTPDNIAVVFEEKQLTYQELNAKANQLAHYLRERGVKPDTLVALACERSLELIIGILGILKAGGAYVPMDPSYPEDRIQFMLEDTQSPLLLTEQNILERLPATHVEVFLLDKDQEKLTLYPTDNPSHTTQPHHLAYVIYTSGSTGRPKGVMIEHQSICNRLFWWQEYIPLSPDDRYLHQFSFSFDGAVVSLWWPLINGAIVIMPSQDGLSDGEYLSQLIFKHRITSLLSTPSLMTALLDFPSIQKAYHVRNIMLAGEPFTRETFEKLLKIGDRKIYNFYGPTESSIISTSFDTTGKDITSTTVPIGSPVANTQIYVLDSSLNPVPLGVIGELYIGGIGLARGYLNRPELSAEKFIANPFQAEGEQAKGENGRLYKSGDLCRWLEDGNIEYIGRIDDQVKVRGFRIELGEIEAALLQHYQVKEALVIGREDTLGDKRLVGYIVPKTDEDVDSESLRAHIQNRLPEYMIPSAYVTLNAIPLTPNGKADRKALPAPKYRGDEKAYVAPRTEAERVLCEIWQDVLKIERVGIQDNFFALGGHSLLATQVVSRLRSQYNIELPLSGFFKQATINDLTKAIEEKKRLGKNKFPSLVAVKREKENFV